MSNIIDFDDYALAKDPENEWVENYANEIRQYLKWDHLALELELAATRYYRILNGIENVEEGDWTFGVDCYLGVPDHINLLFEIEEYHVTCVKIPLGVVVQLGLITGKSYQFSLVLEKKKEDEGASQNVLIHTNLYDFFQEWISLDDDIKEGVEPWDEDNEKFIQMYIDNAVNNAWKKEQHVAMRLQLKDREDLKTRIIHQILTFAIMIVDGEDPIVEKMLKRTGEAEEISEIFSVPNVDLLWDLGSHIEDFSDYYPDKEYFIESFVHEVEFWSPEFIWMIKDPNRQRRWDYAKIALQNSGIDYRDFGDDEDGLISIHDKD